MWLALSSASVLADSPDQPTAWLYFRPLLPNSSCTTKDAKHTNTGGVQIKEATLLVRHTMHGRTNQGGNTSGAAHDAQGCQQTQLLQFLGVHTVSGDIKSVLKF
jgi:hypothetical protein